MLRASVYSMVTYGEMIVVDALCSQDRLQPLYFSIVHFQPIK